MAKSPVEVWLWLLLVMKPANARTTYILSQCGGDASEACRNIRDGKYDFLSEFEMRNAQNVRTKDVQEVMDVCSKNNVNIITLDDEDYPPLLRGIENPPIVLFCAGDIKSLGESVSLSAVGARKISEYGIKVINHIIPPLAKLGVVIISGMAVGADAQTHTACLSVNGKTVGVLGCGILVNYPAENAELKRSVVAHGGAIISELLPNGKTFPGYFQLRNRIISGLAHGTLVVEASEKSGSLITAAHTLAQERDLFCVPPHDLFDTRFLGVVPLLREDAIPAYNFTDILNVFSMYFSNENYVKDYAAVVEKTQHELKEPNKPISKEKKSAKQHEEPQSENPKTKLTEEFLSTLEPDEAALIMLLAECSAKMDDLLEKSGLEYGDAANALTNLEIGGYVERSSEGYYTIS